MTTALAEQIVQGEHRFAHLSPTQLSGSLKRGRSGPAPTLIYLRADGIKINIVLIVGLLASSHKYSSGVASLTRLFPKEHAAVSKNSAEWCKKIRDTFEASPGEISLLSALYHEKSPGQVSIELSHLWNR